MKYQELRPTEENLYRTYVDDTIGRNALLYKLTQLLVTTDSAMSIAIDGDWGSGKSFFVKQEKMILDTYNDHIESNYGNNSVENIKKAFAKSANASGNTRDETIVNNPVLAIYYDAWENDDSYDPVMSLVLTICDTMDVNFPSEYNVNLLDILKMIPKIKNGVLMYETLSTAVQEESLLETVKVKKDLKNKIKNFIDGISNEIANRIVIFVDELDRCNPEFAIRFLERIKHYFDNDKVIFIFSVNMKEFLKTVKKVYGEEFSATDYCDRFFDLRINLPQIDVDKFFSYIGFYEEGNIGAVCIYIIKKKRFTMRQTIRYLNMVEIATKEMSSSDNPAGIMTRFDCTFLLPIIIELEMTDTEKFKAFINGEDGSELELFIEDRERSRLLNYYLFKNYVIADCGENTEKQSKLMEVYNNIFNETFGYESLKEVGNLRIRDNEKQKIMERLALLFYMDNDD